MENIFKKYPKILLFILVLIIGYVCIVLFNTKSLNESVLKALGPYLNKSEMIDSYSK